MRGDNRRSGPRAPGGPPGEAHWRDVRRPHTWPRGWGQLPIPLSTASPHPPPRFAWSDADWRGVGPANLVIYRAARRHVHARGSFAAAAHRLLQVAYLDVSEI